MPDSKLLFFPELALVSLCTLKNKSEQIEHDDSSLIDVYRPVVPMVYSPFVVLLATSSALGLQSR